MYRELLTPVEFEFRTFSSDGYSEMIVESNIEFFSLCEHHMVPFFGVAAIGYIPNGKIVGLSKLARTVEYFARRLQVQERMTNQIAEYLEAKLEPQGVGVVVRARHLCQEMRGIKKRDVMTTTSALRGLMFTDSKAREEFLDLAH
jgi:GTP cyclohydrolase I